MNDCIIAGAVSFFPVIKAELTDASYEIALIIVVGDSWEVIHDFIIDFFDCINHRL